VIRVRVDDLAFVDGEAIARPVNATLGATTPVMRRLEVAFGDDLARQLVPNQPLAVGSAVVTGAGALEVELIIHAVVSSDTEQVTPGSVRRATTSALQRAVDFQIERLAMAPFGLGAGNLDIEESAAAMLEVLAAHLARARYPREVTIVVESGEQAAAFEARLPDEEPQ
jgi:O-acetyl-ADP-ribose deacetylase (regulator of RNase III)